MVRAKGVVVARGDGFVEIGSWRGAGGIGNGRRGFVGAAFGLCAGQVRAAREGEERKQEKKRGGGELCGSAQKLVWHGATPGEEAGILSAILDMQQT